MCLWGRMGEGGGGVGGGKHPWLHISIDCFWSLLYPIRSTEFAHIAILSITVPRDIQMQLFT